MQLLDINTWQKSDVCKYGIVVNIIDFGDKKVMKWNFHLKQVDILTDSILGG